MAKSKTAAIDEAIASIVAKRHRSWFDDLPAEVRGEVLEMRRKYHAREYGPLVGAGTLWNAVRKTYSVKMGITQFKSWLTSNE